MRRAFKRFFCSCFFICIVSFSSCSSDDYYSYFHDHVHLPRLGLKGELKQDSLSPIEMLYVTGDYAGVVNSLNYDSRLSVQTQYIYLRALFHLQEWKKIESLAQSYPLPYHQPVLGPYIGCTVLYALLYTGNLDLAKRIYPTVIAVAEKTNVDQQTRHSLMDIYAVILNQPSIALSVGGYYYIQYIKTKRIRFLITSVKNKNPDALQSITWKDFQKGISKNQWNQYLEPMAQYNTEIYLRLLEHLHHNEILAQYFFQHKRYGTVLRYATPNSFFYHASRLIVEKTVPQETLIYAYGHLDQMFFYLAYYYFESHHYSLLEELFSQGFSARALRFVIVAGLNERKYAMLHKILNQALVQYEGFMDATTRSMALYWMGFVTQHLLSYQKAEPFFQQASIKYPNYYYGWESFKSLKMDDMPNIVHGWETIYKEHQADLSTLVARINHTYIDERDLNIQRGMFFLRIRESMNGRTYLRMFLNGMQDKSLYNYPLALLCYKNERMDYYFAYMKRLSFQLWKTTGTYLFFDDMLLMLYTRKYADIIQEASHNYQIPESWLESLILQESGYDYLAKSRVGASGITQLMSRTAEPILKSLQRNNIVQNTNIWDPKTNIYAGAHYLSGLIHHTYKDYPKEDALVLAFASYNAGPTRIKRMYQRIDRYENISHFIESIDFEESRNYAKILMFNKDIYSLLYHK